jgi:hypothetical protein
MSYPLRESRVGGIHGDRAVAGDPVGTPVEVGLVEGSAWTGHPVGEPADEAPDDEAGTTRSWLPAGALLLALIQVVEGAWLLAALTGEPLASQGGLPAEMLSLGELGRWVVVLTAGLRFVAAVGLLTRHRWAWVFVMLLTGVGLAIALASYVFGRPDAIRLLLGVAAAFYLNQPGVRAVFGVRGGRA